MMLEVHWAMQPEQRVLRGSVLAHMTSGDVSYEAPTHEYLFLPNAQTMLVWHGRGRWEAGSCDFAEVDAGRLVVMRPGAGLTPCPTAQGSLVTAFYPGVARRVLGVDASALPRHEVALEDVVGEPMGWLCDALCAARSRVARVALIEAWVLSRLSRSRHDRSLCRYALHDGVDGVSVGGLADRLGVSRRRLHKHFMADMGLSTKRYLRLHRLRHVLARMMAVSGEASKASAEVVWSVVAAECGYYDQSHLIRDMREFTGHTPDGFARLMRRSVRMLDGLAVPVDGG